MDVRNIDIVNANILLKEICSSGGLDFRDLKKRSGLLHQDMMSALRTLFGPEYIRKVSDGSSSNYKYCPTSDGMEVFQRGGIPSNVDAYNHKVEEARKGRTPSPQSYQYLWMGDDDSWAEPLPVYNMGKSYGELSLNILLEKFKPIPIVTAIFNGIDLVARGAWDAYIVKGEYAGKRDEMGRPLIEKCVKEKNISDLFRDQPADISSNDLLSAFEGSSAHEDLQDFGKDVDATLGGLLGSGAGVFEEITSPFDLDDIPF